ncbi:MAG TPA: hypothetical protein VM285_04960 [Polyangia bacterium]|nr:hypothetical protein [Polyangia bacterium]
MTTTDDGMSWEEKRRIRIPGVDGAIRCPVCKYAAVPVGGFWICRNLSCDRLVVR